MPDWKLWVIRGRVELVQLDENRSRGHRQTLFDRDLKRLDEELYYPASTEPTVKTKRFDDMVRIAEGIGSKLEFARVDLYDTNQGLALGEVTLCPNGARFEIRSASLDKRLGAAWSGTRLFP